MEFGSDEMKNLLLDSIGDSVKFKAAMETVMDVVMKYTKKKLKQEVITRKNKITETDLQNEKNIVYTSRIPEHDYEVIQSEVYYRVYRSMDTFILSLQSDTYTEAQRQAWLKTIVFRSVAEYFKKKKKLNRMEFLLKKNDENEDGTNEFIEIEDPDSAIVADRWDGVAEMVEMMNRKDSKAEIILTSMLNLLVFREMFHRKNNGNSEAAAEYMEGKSLYDLTCILVRYIYRIYGVQLKKRHISSLIKAFGSGGEQTEYGRMICSREERDGVCTITSKKVTDWTNRMKTYLMKEEGLLVGEV